MTWRQFKLGAPSLARWVCLAILTVPVGASAASLDTLMLGNSSSESSHNTVLVSAPTSTSILGQPSRRLNVGGSISFDLTIDGTTQNYATVRFWGGTSSVDDRIFLGDQNGNFMSWAQLDDGSSASVTPDRWHYATVPIPRGMTDGQSAVRLSLYAMNDNAAYSNPPASGAQSSSTRPMYAVFSHDDERFAIPDGVPQNPVVAPYDFGVYQRPSAEVIANERQRLVNLANSTATTVRNKQKITAGSDPSLLGGFDVVTNAGSVDANLDATHVAQQNNDNFGPLRGATILAQAYNMQGGTYYQDSSTLERIAWGIDYARRAQGATGGFVDVWNPVQWTGGGTAANPNRTDAIGTLEGINHQEIAKAFLMTRDDMENAGLLDQFIDDDNKASTPMITRRQAYTDLFREIVDLHSGYFGGWNGSNAPRDYGHAPNQDLYQVGGMAWSMEALELLDNDAFAPGNPTASHTNAQAALKTRVYEAAGITTTPYNGSYWFSPAGLPLEAGGLKGGGYSAEYGQRQSEQIWDLVQFVDSATDQAPLIERAGDAANLWQHFWYPVYRSDGSFDIRLEGAINWRNSKINGLERLHPAHFASLDLNDPDVQRMLQLLVMNDQYTIDAPRSGHFWQDSVWMMEQVAQTERLLNELPESDVRLPFETGQPDSAWIDPVGGAVAIHRGDNQIFMALNWHHGSSGSLPTANEIARIHEITPYDDRVATVSMESPASFFGLSYVGYGDLMVATNSHALLSYNLSVTWSYDWVFDLVSQSFLQLTNGTLQVGPRSGVVLVLDESLQYLPGDFDDDGDVDGRDFLVWQRNPPVGNLADWQANYGTGIPLTAAVSVVPEPSALVLLLGCATVLGFHRRYC